MIPLVSVCMITYNHEGFIAQAIESVISQKTDFGFELVIGEDCSKDNTRKICEDYADRYPGIIRLLPKTSSNLGMQPNFLRTYEACKGTYMAILEGDDYWIDELKLQKQVDFLSQHTDYMAIGGNALQSENNKLNELPIFAPEKIVPIIRTEDFVTKNRVLTLTMMFRKQLISEEVKKVLLKAPIGDWPLWIYLTRFGLFKFQEETWAVYRVHSGGVFSSLSLIKRQLNDIITRDILNTVTGNQYRKEINGTIKVKAFKLIKYQVRSFEWKFLPRTLSLYLKALIN